jgi:hypothetical protein
MKKTVIFHLEYESANGGGSIIEKRRFSIFQSKSVITDAFFEWLNEESDKIEKSRQEDVYIKNPKIINL